MAGAQDTTAQLETVLRLVGKLADQVLDAQIMQRPVADEQVRALANAALLLEAYDIALPPMLLQVLHGLESAASAHLDDVSPEGRRPASEPGAAKGFARLLRPFRNHRS